MVINHGGHKEPGGTFDILHLPCQALLRVRNDILNTLDTLNTLDALLQQHHFFSFGKLICFEPVKIYSAGVV